MTCTPTNYILFMVYTISMCACCRVSKEAFSDCLAARVSPIRAMALCDLYQTVKPHSALHDVEHSDQMPRSSSLLRNVSDLLVLYELSDSRHSQRSKQQAKLHRKHALKVMSQMCISCCCILDPQYLVCYNGSASAASSNSPLSGGSVSALLLLSWYDSINDSISSWYGLPRSSSTGVLE